MDSSAPPPTAPQAGDVSYPFLDPVGTSGAGFAGDAIFQDHLRGTTAFHVKQKVELVEIALGWESENNYTVMNEQGKKVFYVGEESSCFARQCGEASRPFKLHVKDLAGQHVITFERPFECGAFCLDVLGMSCGSDILLVTSSTGQFLGSISKTCTFIKPVFVIKNATGTPVLRVKGPSCMCCGQVVFDIITLDGSSIGTITKELRGLIREMFTDADYFSISFPADLDQAIKAVCLGLLFLIDYQYFEHGKSSL